jgi:Flp pilus assembly protein TadG
MLHRRSARSRACDCRFARQSGQAAVEVAIAVPVLVAILLAVVQFGTALHDFLTITQAARDGARSATAAPATASTVQDAIDATKASASGLDATKLAVAVTPPQPWASGSDVTVTVTYPYSIGIAGFLVSSGRMTARSVAAAP